MERLKIIPSKYFSQYNKSQPITLIKHFNKIKTSSFDYGYAVTESAVASSQIEGNILDIDTYVKFNTTGMNTNTKPFREIKYLEAAYKFAKTHVLNAKNILHAHFLLSDPDVFEEKYRGKYRDLNVFVGQGKMVLYVATAHDIVFLEMDKFISDILLLRKRQLTIQQTFYFASLIHLVFVKIHPFADGNGRVGRLLEKWFLAEKLGDKAWFINSEKLYSKRRKSYCLNISDLGKNYIGLDYDYCIPFLKMLPMALRVK